MGKLTKKIKNDESLFCCFTGLFCSILLFQIGFIDNFYLKMFSMFLYFCLNELWVPITLSLLQKTLEGSKISAGAALFMIFENLGGCAGNFIVGFLIDIFPFSKTENLLWAIFPIMITALLVSSLFSYRLSIAITKKNSY